MARDAARAASAADGNVRIRLELDAGMPSMTTDMERLRQALLNILSNAVQAVAGRQADIRLQTLLIDARRLAIIVTDNGGGIAPEDLPRLFDPYFTTRRTGTGIGLAISRNIIEGLGGRITVASERDRGTEVRIELPLDVPIA
jgi:two-component system sensor histidine kinase AtoS